MSFNMLASETVEFQTRYACNLRSRSRPCRVATGRDATRARPRASPSLISASMVRGPGPPY